MTLAKTSTYKKANSNIKKQINMARKNFNEGQGSDKMNENKQRGQQFYHNKRPQGKF